MKGSKASFKIASQLQSAARERALTSSRNDAKEGEDARSTKCLVLLDTTWWRKKKREEEGEPSTTELAGMTGLGAGVPAFAARNCGGSGITERWAC